MACSGGGGVCQSDCYKSERLEVEEEEEKEEYANDVQRRRRNGECQEGLCNKCKEEKAITSPREGGLCVNCFRSNLYSKFKLAVTSHSMISPTDNVLVAFSAGPSSRVALQFVHEMQLKAHMNFVASKDRSLPVFGVGVAFIDETAISMLPSEEVEIAIEEIKLTVSSLAPPAKDFHVVPIGNIFSPEVNEGRNKLKELLHSTGDITGKEDLLQYLRMLCLQKFALEKGYTKLVLGSCTSRIACHIISATVKGQGYSLPADIQYVDARNQIPVVLPLRDCLVRELKLLCSLDSLKTLPLFDSPSSGINGLVSSFVALLQEENPSRERTIVRTAEKLSPFCFNELPKSNSFDDELPSRRRKSQSVKPKASIQADILCPICSSPLSVSELRTVKSEEGSNQTKCDKFAATCCSSCCFQILPKEPSSIEHFYSLLPEIVTKRVEDGSRLNHNWLREQIKDCLLSDDDEDES